MKGAFEMKITAIGIDLAKNVIQVHGVDARGRTVLRELWVRVYPDECLVDSFEPTLTEQEVKNLRVFWAKIWSAGGVEERERAAWRDLAASHGVGRAGWIIGQYVPLNPGDKPLRDTDSDILLIVPADPPLAAEAVAFWTDVWRAGGDAAAISALRPALVNALGEAQTTAVFRTPP